VYPSPLLSSLSCGECRFHFQSTVVFSCRPRPPSMGRSRLAAGKSFFFFFVNVLGPPGGKNPSYTGWEVPFPVRSPRPGSTFLLPFFLAAVFPYRSPPSFFIHWIAWSYCGGLFSPPSYSPEGLSLSTTSLPFRPPFFRGAKLESWAFLACLPFPLSFPFLGPSARIFFSWLYGPPAIVPGRPARALL